MVQEVQLSNKIISRMREQKKQGQEKINNSKKSQQ